MHGLIFLWKYQIIHLHSHIPSRFLKMASLKITTLQYMLWELFWDYFQSFIAAGILYSVHVIIIDV